LEKQTEISTLSYAVSQLKEQAQRSQDAERRLEVMDEKLSCLREENRKLNEQNKQLNETMDQVLKKLQRTLDERPNFIDKRTVLAAVQEYVNREGDKGQALRRLGDKLGLSEDERIGLKPKPTVADAFVEFLAENTD
jgi:hypothetical protein